LGQWIQYFYQKTPVCDQVPPPLEDLLDKLAELLQIADVRMSDPFACGCGMFYSMARDGRECWWVRYTA
jgi:hypothetical protein